MKLPSLNFFKKSRTSIPQEISERKFSFNKVVSDNPNDKSAKACSVCGAVVRSFEAAHKHVLEQHVMPETENIIKEVDEHIKKLEKMDRDMRPMMWFMRGFILFVANVAFFGNIGSGVLGYQIYNTEASPGEHILSIFVSMGIGGGWGAIMFEHLFKPLMERKRKQEIEKLRTELHHHETN